jgi:hypothetical protein
MNGTQTHSISLGFLDAHPLNTFGQRTDVMESKNMKGIEAE